MTEKLTETMAPGTILCEPGTLQLNADRPAITLTVANHGDRPVQIGSHYHFFEVNKALSFNRASAYGFRLDIPAGTAVRFEPGDTKEVTLVAMAGDRMVYGLHGLVQGDLDNPEIQALALERMEQSGFTTSES